MSKFSGMIGFAEYNETSPGVTIESIVAKKYKGILLENSRRLISGDQSNDTISVTNRISIIADPFAKLNFHLIRYAEFMGSKWKVTNVSVEYPRLVLTLGGIYNGNAY